ncbi:MAG: hypothetical protein ISS52_04910 [Dehalococcoidia bacterium]|nr:hypothetical protein [Dehalococcoidia bacterium]
MIYWAQLLHFYQPPTQSPGVLHKICDESYRPLLKVLLQYPHAKVTVNISGVLTEMLHDCGHDDVIDGLVQLAKRGQIEFTGSGKYHPILPLIPRREIDRQIQLNVKTNRRFLGKVYKPQGFFSPEMCYGKEIVSPIVNSGHQWITLSGVACPNSWPVDMIHYVECDGERLATFFRDDVVSNKISFESAGPSEFLDNLMRIKGDREEIYVVTATDAETFGHHIKRWEELFLAEVYRRVQPSNEGLAASKQATVSAYQRSSRRKDTKIARAVRAVGVSQLLELFPFGEAIEPRQSSWSTSHGDLAAGNPYPLWMNKDNEIHRLQWEHLGICFELVDKATQVSDSDETKRCATIARGSLDMALHSCQFWWASQRPMWDINLVHKGLFEQWESIVNAYRAINLSQADEGVKRGCYHRLVVARNLRDKITDRLFL